MTLSLPRFVIRAYESMATGGMLHRHRSGRRASDGGLQTRARLIGIEALEQRMALTAAPTIGLTAASDTGVRGDGITQLARPVFAGTATAKAIVYVYADGTSVDGTLLGVTKANARGTWLLATPVSKGLAAGEHVLQAYAAGPDKLLSTATSFKVTIDPIRPTALISYDPDYSATPGGNPTGRVTLAFSEPVRGVRIGNVYFTDPVLNFSVPLNSPALKPYVGTIAMTQLSDRSYAFTPSVRALAPGSYTLIFRKTGVTDLAGNPLEASASTTLTFS